MTKNCNTSPFYLQGQSPTIQNQVAIIERFLKKQLPNYAVITVSLNGVDIPKDEFGNVNLEIERINYAAGDGISIDDNVISCTITDTTYTAGENISIDENNVISTTVIDDSTQSNKSTWSSNKINSLIQEFNNFTITVVNQLPVIGEPYVLYLVGNGSEEQSNVNDEYLWIVENNVGRWEKIGTTQITILQSDWHQSDTTAQDYIKNKPTDLVHTSDIEGLLRNDGSVYTGKYLEQVQDLDNFQASEGKIVQYIGATNSKYTNGFIYKKVGTQIIIPVGTEYINIQDSYGALASVGIPNGIYYKINDTNDKIKYDENNPTKSRICYQIKTPNNSTGYPVKKYNNVTRGVLGLHGYIDAQFSKIIKNDVYISGDIGVEYENGQKCSYNMIDGGNTLLDSESVNIYENEDGIRVYVQQGNFGYGLSTDYRYVLVLEYDTDDGIYRAIAGRKAFCYIFNTTTSQQSINNSSWQQLDVQPRDDTSHFVTDSEIGWIEH